MRPKCDSGSPARRTRQQVDFWVLLHATEIESEQAYWDRSLDDLARHWGHSGNWTIHAGNTIEPVAGEVVHSLRSYAWPAIQAALDNPGYPPDRSTRWARTFPKIPRGPRFDDEAAAAERSRGEAADLVLRAASDPGALQALLARLETEPDPGIRRDVAWYLSPRACEEEIGRALQAANAEDEDIGVRWIARYALPARGGHGWFVINRLVLLGQHQSVDLAFSGDTWPDGFRCGGKRPGSRRCTQPGA